MYIESLVKKDSTIPCLQEIHFKYEGTDRLEVKGWMKNKLCEHYSKESWSDYLHVTKCKFQSQA